MSTLVALSTKDALVLGCDALESRSRRIIAPADLLEFFDPDKDYQLKVDKDGEPVIKSFHDVYSKSVSIPSEHLTHITKLISLEPLKAAVMFTGITSIGSRTIKSLIEEFKALKCKDIEAKGYTVKNIAEQMLEYISLRYYEPEYPDVEKRPELEMILGGFSQKENVPEIYKIKLPAKNIEPQLGTEGAGRFGVVLGGQTKEIQRIVFGTDATNKLRLSKRHFEILEKYRQKVCALLKSNNIDFKIPEFTKDDSLEYSFFAGNWKLEELEASWGDLSEQNAVECVDFLVNIMIKSQQLSSGLPTVGGEVHIALVTKDEVRFVSKEEYSCAAHLIPNNA